MARRTMISERLREVCAALGNDSFRIQECLARPALVDRLARNLFDADRARRC
ncbi:MAG TPA: hypothetical protein VGV60_06620 [Candidatus Polarisedimenticolia bacterium]|nr:hypothetical protein [Candidatus Polarisedimenticolia bacterium]